MRQSGRHSSLSASCTPAGNLLQYLHARKALFRSTAALPWRITAIYRPHASFALFLHHLGGTAGLLLAISLSACVSAQPMGESGPAAALAPPSASQPIRPAPSLPELPPSSPPVIQSSAAILVDSETGQVIFEKNADVERPMASTTKIMTALLFCEHVPENAIITAGPLACATGDSSMHLKLGERVPARDLLMAILMRSANDGCVAAAEHVAGSEAAFVAMMNARAASLGALHTHFTNPHGLPAPDHYTSARDLATIACAAMREPRIRAVVRTQIARITRSLDHDDVTMRNHSHFLGKFPGADGVKTGWTRAAGHCYVGSAKWGDWRLISVVLNSPNYVEETSALMKYGFGTFQSRQVAAAGEPEGVCLVTSGQAPTVHALLSEPLHIVVRKGSDPDVVRRTELKPVAAPIRAGEQVGRMTILVDGQETASASLVAAQDVPHAGPLSAGGMGPWRRMSFALGILATSLVSLRYGTRQRTRFSKVTKGNGGRRRRVAASLRNDDLSG